MGGKVWSAEEEKYFWEVIVPQAPAGLDAVSKQAKKAAHTAWAPLSSQMEREMTRRLKPEERLRRKYTPIGCYEHYFQNYINRHYSPHAKALVLKYQHSLNSAASTADHQSPDDDNDDEEDEDEIKSQTSPESATYSHMRHNNRVAIPMPMPEALMTGVQDQGGPSSMQVLAARAIQQADSFKTERNERSDEDLDRSSLQSEKSYAPVADDEIEDAAEDSCQPGTGPDKPAQHKDRKTQKDQRRTRKVAHRRAQASDVVIQSTTPTPTLPSGFPNVHPGYYNDTMMYGQQPPYFGHSFGMQPGDAYLQNSNAFQSNHAVRTNGFNPCGVPPQLGYHPRFNGTPYSGFGAHFPQHSVPYMGGYYNPGYTQYNGQGYGDGSAYVGGNESMSGSDNEMRTSSGPVEKDSQYSSTKK